MEPVDGHNGHHTACRKEEGLSHPRRNGRDGGRGGIQAS
jgi:hypothetical protein